MTTSEEGPLSRFLAVHVVSFALCNYLSFVSFSPSRLAMALGELSPPASR
jgi:hypothetical protein